MDEMKNLKKRIEFIFEGSSDDTSNAISLFYCSMPAMEPKFC